MGLVPNADVVQGNALSRPEQLPTLAEASGWTSGIWAPSLRYNNGTFYIVTTLVFDEKPWEDSGRWDNVRVRIFQSVRFC